jgi:hypothetical protein
MLDALYDAWKIDTDCGLHSLMLASNIATVNELNARARSARVTSGFVAEEGIDVAGAMTAGVNDLVVTRENDRRLTTGTGWVKNGDVWTVSATHENGSMTVARASGHGSVVLPASYVAKNVELAYASTAHRAQGRTVDTAHAFASPTTTRIPTTTLILTLATMGSARSRAPWKCSPACCATREPTCPPPT